MRAECHSLLSRNFYFALNGSLPTPNLFSAHWEPVRRLVKRAIVGELPEFRLFLQAILELKTNLNFCKEHCDEIKVPDPLAAEDLISYKLNK